MITRSFFIKLFVGMTTSFCILIALSSPLFNPFSVCFLPFIRFFSFRFFSRSRLKISKIVREMLVHHRFHRCNHFPLRQTFSMHWINKLLRCPLDLHSLHIIFYVHALLTQDDELHTSALQMTKTNVRKNSVVVQFFFLVYLSLLVLSWSLFSLSVTRFLKNHDNEHKIWRKVQ